MNNYFYLVCQPKEASNLVKGILKRYQVNLDIKIAFSIQDMFSELQLLNKYPLKIFIDENILGNLEEIHSLKKKFPFLNVTILTNMESSSIYQYQHISFQIKDFVVLEPPTNDIKILKGIISLKIGAQILLIRVEDILLIERQKNITYIYCNNGKSYSIRISLLDLEEKLRGFLFFRTHQSYLVPLSKINKIMLDEFVTSYIIEIYGTNKKAILSKHKYKDIKDILLLHTI